MIPQELGPILELSGEKNAYSCMKVINLFINTTNEIEINFHKMNWLITGTIQVNSK